MSAWPGECADVARVSAVVVNYNAGPDLVDALRSINGALPGREWDAVVVDNASSDGSARIPSDLAPRVRVIANSQNTGFARGVNQGLAATTGEFVLILNPDCQLRTGAGEALLEEIQRPGCAIAGPRILDPDGNIQGSARGDPDMLTGLFGRTGWLRRALPHLGVSRRNVIDPVMSDSESAAVDWVSGACMLARRDALASVGGFDERYFLYWEDADLCRRLRRKGYEVRYVPAAVAVHKVGVSSRSSGAEAIRAFHESAYLYYATHVAPSAAAKRALARLLLRSRCWLRLRARNRASTRFPRRGSPPAHQSPSTR